MRKLSTWAKYNPAKARLIIITAHIILGIIACYLGSLLSGSDIILSETFLAIWVAVFIATAFFYPLYRKHRPVGKRKFYIQRKTSDFIIAACSFCMMCWAANNFNDNLPQLTQPLLASSVTPSWTKPAAEEILKSLEHRDKKSLTRTEKRILKKEFKHQLKEYVKAKIAGKKDNSDKALLSILAIIGALGLLWLVGVLACNLSCNGSDAAAIVVGVVGITAVIWLFIIVIRSIRRGKKKTAQTTETGLP